MDNMTTGQRIAECRKKLGLSQEGLGEKVGVSRQAISKWEADAAMPDIDKLISLSRLFSVSVGWLLGVEELPEPQPESTQVSEELLHKIEDVVRQYQPRKKHSPWKIAAGLVLAVLLLWGGIGLGREWHHLRNQVAHLAGQMQNNNNSAVLSQLNQLEDRIDSLSSAPEHFSIADWSYQIEPDSGKAQAIVLLTAIPGFWQENYDAVLSVRRDGQQVVSQACAWDGTALTARLVLPLENGYEYWLTAKYADGTQEQVELPNSTARNLKSSFTIGCTIVHGIAGFDVKESTMTLAKYQIHLDRPNLTSGYDVDWGKAELLLYHTRGSSRQIADTYIIFDPEDFKEEQEPGVAQEIHNFVSYPNGPFRLPELQEGDGLELWVSAEMSNGISLMEMVDSWAYLDGEFISGVPVE